MQKHSPAFTGLTYPRYYQKPNVIIICLQETFKFQKQTTNCDIYTHGGLLYQNINHYLYTKTSGDTVINFL